MAGTTGSPVAYVGIGANLGRREEAVLGALRMIEVHGAGEVAACSALYEANAVDMGPAPPFINAVALIRALLSPADLLNRLKTIEKRMGRRSGHQLPRELDIDILAYGDVVLDTSTLTIPHPRYHVRGFVLLPLREIAPGFVCPRTGRSLDRMIESIECRDPVVRISGRSVMTRTQR